VNAEWRVFAAERDDLDVIRHPDFAPTIRPWSHNEPGPIEVNEHIAGITISIGRPARMR
jgi:hypothetical protein